MPSLSIKNELKNLSIFFFFPLQFSSTFYTTRMELFGVHISFPIEWVILALVVWRVVWPTLRHLFGKPTDVKRRYAPSGEEWALITGASKGIGAAFAHELAARNVNVLLAARSEAVLRELCANIRKAHPNAKTAYFLLDAFQPWDELRPKIEAAVASRRISILVNNVGIAEAGLSKLEEQDLDFQARLIQVNCTFTTLLTKLLIPKLKAEARACILNIGSLSAVDHMPYYTTYSASKSFLRTFSKALAVELAPTVDVQVFNIGPVATDMIGISESNLLIQKPRSVAARILNATGKGDEITPVFIHLAYSTFRYNWLYDARMVVVRKAQAMQAERDKAKKAN